MERQPSLRNVRVVRRRARAELGLVGAVWAVPTLLLATLPGFRELALLWCAAAALAGWVWWTNEPRRLALRGAVRVVDGALYLDEVELASKQELRSGFVSASTSGSALVLLDHRGLERISVELDRAEEGPALLASLRLGPDRAVAHYILSGAGPRTTAWTLAAGLAPPLVVLASYGASMFARGALGWGPTPATAVMVLLLAFAALVGLFSWRRKRLRLSIGPDGVSIERRAGHRFLRYDEIAGLRWWPGAESGEGVDPAEGFDLLLRSGERVPLRSMEVRAREGDAHRDPVYERIRQGIALGGSHRVGRGGVGADRALLRGPIDDVRGWIGALRATPIGAGDTLRTPPTTPEELWALVEDPRAEPVTRAAAAVALTAAQDVGARVRIEEIAESVASPDLRALLESCAGDEDDDELEAPMATLVAR